LVSASNGIPELIGNVRFKVHASPPRSDSAS
jgi:hypothetical protein